MCRYKVPRKPYFHLKTGKTRRINPKLKVSCRFVWRTKLACLSSFFFNIWKIFTPLVDFLEIFQYLIFDDKLISIFSFPHQQSENRDRWLQKLQKKHIYHGHKIWERRGEIVATSRKLWRHPENWAILHLPSEFGHIWQLMPPLILNIVKEKNC